MEVDLINKKLEEIKAAFDSIKKSGINPEILEIYLRFKTHLTQKQIKLMLYHTKEFFDTLVKETEPKPAELRDVLDELIVPEVKNEHKQ